jgi:hypothetical protein
MLKLGRNWGCELASSTRPGESEFDHLVCNKQKSPHYVGGGERPNEERIYSSI